MLFFLRMEEAVSWWRDRPHQRKGRAMGSMTVPAMIALSGTTRKIPVALHPSMRALLVVSILRTMALSAELHRVLSTDWRAVSKMKLRPRVLIVTGCTAQISVLKLHVFVDEILTVSRLLDPLGE